MSNNESMSSRQSQRSPQMRAKIKVRWWHILLIAVTVVAFLGLAWWQWTRFQSGSGSFQNLGYAFQWPLFAGFVVYAYRTAMHYENERIEAENQAAAVGDQEFEYVSEKDSAKHKTTRIDEDLLPSRPTVNVDEFNAMNVQRRLSRRAGDIDAKSTD